MQVRSVDDSGLVQALLWGIGGPSPDTVEFSAPELLGAVRDHRIAGRLLERAAREPQDWLDEGVLGSLEAEQRRQVDALAERTGTMRELAEAYGGGHEPLVLIKGMSAYLHTGRRPNHARSSTDLDVLAGNPEAVSGHLIRLGYEFDQGIAPHELARFVRDGTYIELHGYIPVFSDSRAVEPAPWGRVDRQPIHALGRKDIRINDLARDARRFQVDRVDIVVPSAEMCALIICAHLYRNQLSLPGPARFATVRLCDVAELEDLRTCDGFDVQAFDELVSRYDAQAAVAYAEGLADGLLSRPPGALGSPDLMRRSLWWDNGQGAFLCTTSPAETPADLVVRTRTLGDLLNQLGGNDIDTDTAAPSGWTAVSTSSQGAGTPLTLLAAHSVNAETLDVDVAVRRDAEEGVEFEISVSPLLEDVRDREGFLWNFGTAIFECEYGAPGDAEATTMDRLHDEGPRLGGVVASTTPEGRRTFRIPWEAVGGAADTEPLALVLGVRRRTRLVAMPHSATLIPLRIHGPRSAT